MIIEQARAQPEPKQGERKDFGNYLQKGLQILQLDVKTIRAKFVELNVKKVPEC